jgi:tRNA threonylcarbamoyl adenosine modification protein (Sua5/YciO/YrdC/YwlC family)
MPEVADWSRAPQWSDIVHRAAAELAAGHLVAFPTETVYGLAASALLPDAVECLRKGKGRPADKPLALAVRDAAEAIAYVADASRTGRRLAQRCFPGAVTLVFAVQSESGPFCRLPAEVRQRISPAGTIGLRVPDHPAILHVLEQLPGPLVLTSANRSGAPAAATAEEVIEAVGDEVALVIDDGPCRYGRASTVVQVNGDSWKILREGVVSAAEIERQAACQVVFICTGNTCRSPMAQALCEKMLAERLDCTPAELPAHGFCVQSAGLVAMIGDEAAPEALTVGREFGIDLTRHESRPLTARLALQADYLIGMTQSHLLAVATRFPEASARVRLLSAEGGDLPDPIGCEEEVYRECAQRIVRDLERLVPELKP